MNRKKGFIKAARKNLIYMISLPERAIRSLAALTGGTTSLLTEIILPESLRNTTIYNVSFGMMQRFVVEKVAAIEGEISRGQKEIGDDYLLRKMTGTALEAAGLLAMRFSPLWVFAIAADAAGGSKVFLERLVKHLKENDIIAVETNADNLIDLLEAVQRAAGSSTVTIDTPPLSREKLIEMVDDIRSEYGRVFKTTANLIPKIDVLWANMEQVAKRYNISIERLGGLIAVDALSLSKKGSGMVSATGRIGIELFDEKILDSYRITLSEISEKGLDRYMRTHMRPFMKAAKSHFNPDRKTWIESKFRKRRKGSN